jgi:GMP synthase (glutamine-hydrolysing)
MRETVIVLDFGSQYNQLIARRVRQLGVYCELLPNGTRFEELKARDPKAVILSGGPASVTEAGAPGMDERVLTMGVPVLGICYGMQLVAKMLGGKVVKAESREYGPAVLSVDEPDRLLAGCGTGLDIWMSHGDQVDRMPEGFRKLAHTPTCPVAAMGDASRKVYGVQFHPEVVHTPCGLEVFRNFLFKVAGCKGGWTMAGFV